MTKFKTAEGWSYLVVVLDWYSKKIVGHHLSLLSRAGEWLEALEEGVIPFIKNKVHLQQRGALIFAPTLLAPKQLNPKGLGDAGGSKSSGCPTQLEVHFIFDRWYKQAVYKRSKRRKTEACIR